MSTKQGRGSRAGNRIKKIARICWNNRDWTKPSGPKGKSKSRAAFEHASKAGFGFEEWLFNRDSEKTIRGYRYGYLQGLDTKEKRYTEVRLAGKRLDIYLYTINSDAAGRTRRFLLGCIHNATQISEVDSKDIFNIYKSRGWLSGMRKQVIDAKGSPEEFEGMGWRLFNLKFKESDLDRLESPPEFSRDDDFVKRDRYDLKDWIKNPKFLIDKTGKLRPSGRSPKKISTTRHIAGGEIEVRLDHNRIQADVRAELESGPGKRIVEVEYSTDADGKVDLAVERDDGKWDYYEIKTGRSAKRCIRDALSQLMEYAYWPDKERAAKLVIVAPAKLGQEGKRYLEHLRSRFDIPVCYRRYNENSQPPQMEAEE